VSGPEPSADEGAHAGAELSAGDDDEHLLHAPGSDLSVERLLELLEQVTAERDTYLDDSRRLAAEFSNFRRQTEKRQSDLVAQAAAGLAEQLLPVLDACESALAHGAADVEPIFTTLALALQKAGLEALKPDGEAFDPTRHDAVMHEPGDDAAEPQVSAVLRTGYAWHGKVLRPAMVRVRG
jgi:molecular chaperone GrpE